MDTPAGNTRPGLAPATVPVEIAPGDRSRRIGVLFLVVFVDLLGFGILIPLIPFYALRLGLSPAMLTLVISLHSLFQFIGAPLLGRLSDRFGRRPVLIVSMAGHAAAYALLAFADTVALLVLSRMLSGFTSGNLAAAQAYVTDITPADDRAGGLGKISAAFALGFALGPGIGALLSGGGAALDANFMRPALAAAVLSLASLASIVLFLPESRDAAMREAVASARRTATSRASGWRNVLARPLIATALGVGVVVFVFAAMRETLFALWMHDVFAYGTGTIGLVFALNGLAIAAFQFFAMGPAVRRYGEMTMLRVGIAAYAISWAGLVFATGLYTVLLSMCASAIATATFATSLQTILARHAGASERGSIMGATQSASSLARFAGSAGSGTIYGRLGHDAPFAIGAIAMIPAMWLALRLGRLHDAALARETREPLEATP